MDIDEHIAKLEAYYRARAPEYEAIYYRPDRVRRAELAEATTAVMGAVAGRRVLEIACGTGFWTEFAAETAAEIVATDINSEMLEIARSKPFPRGNVSFDLVDAYTLDRVPGTFTAGMANFWISHVPRDRLQSFVTAFHRRLGSGAFVFMMDNLKSPGHGGEFLRIPGVADTFKIRDLADGSTHTVIKNYFSNEELHALFAPQASDLQIEVRAHYWWVTYAVALDRDGAGGASTDAFPS